MPRQSDVVLTRNEAIAQLRAEQSNGDYETAHGRADEILCELLAALGYQDVVDEYEKVGKWYA